MCNKNLLLVFFLLVTVAHAQPSPYFPEIGARAVAQDIREIKNPSVYLVIAIAPGFEDLASISHFKVGEGSSVSVAYVTNGEDIPSDLNGEMFYQLASRRKEEAYHALSYFGVQSYFLNIPVDQFSAGAGCFHETPELNEMLSSRLDSLISQIKPDVIVIDHDPLSGAGQSSRLVYLQHFIDKSIHDTSGSSSAPEAHQPSAEWNVKRLFIQTVGRKKAVTVPVDREDPVWAKSYLEMAHEAEKFYESLRFQIALWDENQSHYYARLYPKSAKPPSELDNGIPQIGKELSSLLPAVRSTFSIVRYVDSEKRLSILGNVIARVDAFTYRYQYSLDQRDLRVLTTWKLGLEKLRCAILGVTLPHTVSDTIITPIQVFFLRFAKLDTAFDKGKTQLLFPGVVQKQWIVNEGQKEFYDWYDTAAYRILSPRSIPLNSTETQEGFESMQVRASFIFIVAHQDSNPNHNFMYRSEVPLIIAPYRSVEVLTPQVVMSHDTCLIVRLRSNVRDRSGGVLYVDDPIVSSPQVKVELPGKNYVVTDTVPLIWRDTSLSVPHKVKILAGGGISIGSFVVRKLGVNSNIEKKVGLCSAIENSPVQIALRRLGVTAAALDTSELRDKELSGYSAIIIDRFSLRKFISLSGRWTALDHWIGGGGKLIVLPQYGAERIDLSSGRGSRFAYLPVIGCDEKVIIDSTEKIFNVPNKIGAQSFTGKPFVISYGEITGVAGGDSKVLIKSGERALLLEKRLGRGIIFYCSMNFFPRLLSIDETSYSLLANLLSN